MSPLLRNKDLFTAGRRIKEDLAHAFSDLLSLVGDVAIYYRKRINGPFTSLPSPVAPLTLMSDLSSGSTVIDFHGRFGNKIAAFHQRKGTILSEMWNFKLKHGTGLQISCFVLLIKAQMLVQRFDL